MFVVTIKPGSEPRSRVRTCLRFGISNFRVNFGRKRVYDNIRLVSYCREYSRRVGKSCTVFIDLPGPKIRLGDFRDGSAHLVKGQTFILDSDKKTPCDSDRAYLVDTRLNDWARPRDRLVTAGGPVLRVTSDDQRKLQCVVSVAGTVYTGCGIFNTTTYIPNLSLTELDSELLYKIGSLPDFICASFADDPAVIRDIKNHPACNPKKGVIAKIESPAGLRNLERIAKESDGLMLGRGDLQVFYPIKEVNTFTKLMLRVARENNQILAFATDYFASMVDGGELQHDDRRDLHEALSLNPDYLVINETSYSDFWQSIVLEAIKVQAEISGR